MRLRTLILLLLPLSFPSANSENFYQGQDKALHQPFQTEHPGGILSDQKVVFSRDKSPYRLRNDLIVERNAELVVEPGVTVRVDPQVGITVRGVLTAVGTESERITFTTSETTAAKSISLPDIRLVDGPSILAGRVQLKHNGQWRSICTNSKNWTMADMETACRQLGFQGGRFFMWFNRLMPVKPRMLFEEPKCSGTETSLFQCQWERRQLGAGVCDYHPDLGIECLPRHDIILPFWRGIRFEHASNDKALALFNTMYIPTSFSKLKYVNILFAGAGRDLNTSSALDIEGVPPSMEFLEVINSAYNAINITKPNAPIRINNCTLRNNRGYGLFINSSYGLTDIEGCQVTENGADGIRFVHAQERPDERADRLGYDDFCKLAISPYQAYPLQFFADQNIFSLNEKSCLKTFTTRYGQVLTLNFIRAVTDRNNSASIEIYDGSNLSNRLIKKFEIRNNTRPQSFTSISNQMFIAFKADPKTEMVIFMSIFSGLDRISDLSVRNSIVSENLGRGIAVDNLKSRLYVYQSSVSKNEHVAGIHVTSGVGDVNITESRVSFNDGDGINITYTGGNRNISRTSISSNRGYGLAIWLNHTKETEYIYVNQTSVVQYSEIYKNLDIGVLHGNYCGDSSLNFTENSFKNSLSDALEILTCWNETDYWTKLFVGHNKFLNNERISLKIYPATNLLADIEFNHFRQGTFGQLLIKNKPLEQFNIVPTNITVQQNYFMNNSGTFVVNLALSQYSLNQHLMFTRNFVKNNKIGEPFQPEDGSVSKLNPRSRVAAPVVVGSSNVVIFRNIIENPESRYEIGSHLEDQSKSINCKMNWLGYSTDEKIYYRLFHRPDRYNLAKIEFIPFLLHNTNPLTTKINMYSIHVPKFIVSNSDKIGGEIEGEETITRGEYVVEKDINIRPGGKLTIEPGVVLKFPPSIGMMVGGKLEARGISPDSIKFTLKEEIVHLPENETYETETIIPESITEIIPIEPKVPIRLLGGRTETEGRLQIKINGEWGTVCNYGWTILNAALVCQQLGYVLNPDDWYLERSEVPEAGTTERVILSNVHCDDFDLDITKCRAERVDSFENSCSHEHDVGVRCYQTSWAGVRFGPLSERTDMQYITIEQSGLLDYATNSFKPALQLDFAKHNFDSIRVVNNYYHGLGVMYSHIYTDESVNNIKNSDFSNNRGAGIAFKQLGLNLFGGTIESNHIGIKHNPMLSGLQQRELAGWFIKNDEGSHYDPIQVPDLSDENIIFIERGVTKYLITSRIKDNYISRSYKIRCDPSWVLGIQLLNPIENRSTEQIFIHDSLTINNKSDIWNLKRDLTVFPTTSGSHGIILDYSSGNNAIGGTVLILSSIRAPAQTIYNRIVKGPVPTLTVRRVKIRNNTFGIHGSYYNRYLDDLGNHFLRKANETIQLINCEISHNVREAVFMHSPFWDLHRSNLSEIKLLINNSLITDNGKGLYHFSRDMRASNNLFHYILQDNTIDRNFAGGFDVSLPYVWQYNENFTHSIYMDNNTWVRNKLFSISIDGHFAIVNITNSIFQENSCKDGLIAFKGMEKKMLIKQNKFLGNNGKYVVEFSCNSQSEIIGSVPASFYFNELRNNRFQLRGRGSYGILQIKKDPTCVVGFKGVQKVDINRNLFSGNTLDYQLLAGIKTAKINNFLNVMENWWGTTNGDEIKKMIFDFDDWNDHAVAQFRPYLINDDFQASYSESFSVNRTESNVLGGRLEKDLELFNIGRPYIVNSDITIMPSATLTIYPEVVLEFAPNVGILVLGRLNAVGFPGGEIIMRPASSSNNLAVKEDYYLSRNKRHESLFGGETIRLCQNQACTAEEVLPNEGFLEYFNRTTLQWIPMCDSRFTERNAQVVCRELGFDPLNAFFEHGVRIDFHSNSLSRIWTWPEPLQCKGTEKRFDECPIRLNGQQFGHRHSCQWNSNFVFVHCDPKPDGKPKEYWGGIRFADSEFEQELYTHRIHDAKTHTTHQSIESTLHHVKIIGAGILHNEKSPAVQTVIKSPSIQFVSIEDTASHGINLISPSKTMNLLNNKIERSMGVGINIISLSGEGRESEESSFTPLKGLNIPYNLFSLVDICDTHKEIRIEERVLLYYKYDNHPVNCIKIFKSAYNIKPLGFRLLQFNLFNSSMQYGIPDFISLYDGDIYNVTSKMIGTITTTSLNEKRLFKTKLPTLSVKLFANGASSDHGFIAEIVTLPISAIGFNRNVQHNISSSVVTDNIQGGLLYLSAGEVNPIVTIEKNQFKNNCRQLFGNFTTCKSAIDMDVQNTENIFFRNNLIDSNQGGLRIKADSRGSATSLQGYIHNNLFVNNTNLPVLYVEGRQSSPYQEVTIYRNYFTRNFALYHNNIILKQVVSNFTYNYVNRNIGQQNLEVSGFDRVRLNIYQTTSHNGFYNNYAIHRDSKSTIVAGTAGQHYVDNIFFNPDNDYEMITVNRSLFEFNSSLQLWDTKIDAAHNYWGFNTTLAVSGRIRDQRDDQKLLEVVYEPYYMNNKSILNVKCPPGWDLVGETCYMYIGAPMTFWEAKSFCQADNASIPYIIGSVNYFEINDFLRKQNEWYLYSTEKIWVQHIDKFNECTMFTYSTIEVDSDCNNRRPFICEIDPKVSISIRPLADDTITIAVISSLALAVLLLALVIACWYSKSQFRKAQRLERRNSIRQSLHSLRSVGLSPATFSDASYRRKAAQLSSRSTDTLTKNSDYKKMITNGSLDSVEKSTYDSSLEDASYDAYSHNPNASFYNQTLEYHKSPSRFDNQYAQPNTLDLAFKNEGFKDNSTFTSAANSNYQSRAQSTLEEEMPIVHSSRQEPDYYNSDTLPLSSARTDSTMEKKKPEALGNGYNRGYDPSFSRERPSGNLMQELKRKLPQSSYEPPVSPTISSTFSNDTALSPDYNTVGLAHSEVLETNFDEVPSHPSYLRSKSEALLETNFDYTPPGGGSPVLHHPINDQNRSKSQPLETAM